MSTSISATGESSPARKIEPCNGRLLQLSQFRRWLRSLAPREELIARMALRDAIREPSASRAWEVRIADLQADLIKTSDDWAELLAAVERAKTEIEK